MPKDPAGPALDDAAPDSVHLDGAAASAAAPAVPLRDPRLAVPPEPVRSVRRGTLLKRLLARPGPRLVALVAPPGYGKTTTLVQWARRDQRPAAWVTVDAGDDDPATFLTDLLAALDRVAPVDPVLAEGISRPGSAPLVHVVPALVAALGDRRSPTLLVLDDAHRLRSQASLDCLVALLEYLPLDWQVALGAREAGGLPIARYRARDEALELGPADLAFDVDEASTMVSAMELALPPGAVERLTERTEGWPVGLLLGALRARETGGDVEVTGSRREVAAYLRSEVLGGRSRSEVTFLTRTAILERPSGPACDAVLGRGGSAARLARLERDVLLVSRLDEDGQAYRYHTLLREFLLDELQQREPERVPGLHRRAAVWFTANAAPVQAVDHAFMAGDGELAATLVGRWTLATYFSGGLATLQGWLRRFAAGDLHRFPWLAVIGGWVALFTGDVPGSERFADIVETASWDGPTPEGAASIESGRALLRSALCRHGPDAMLADARVGLELERPGSPWRATALEMKAHALRLAGELEASDETQAAAVAAGAATGSLSTWAHGLAQRALDAIGRGQWSLAEAFARESREVAAAGRLDRYMTALPTAVAFARIAARRGDVTTARQELSRAQSLRPLVSAACPWFAVGNLVELAEAQLALSDPAAARTALAQARETLVVRPLLGSLVDRVRTLERTLAALPIGLGGPATLTAAELRVLALLPTYMTIAEIAERLSVSRHTVKTQSVSIYGKLGASNRREAVEAAADAGLLEPSVVQRVPAGGAGRVASQAR